VAASPLDGAGAAPDPTTPAAPRGTASPVWWVFGLLATLLVGRNWALFTTRMYEEGDAAANSILVDNAKQFTQLVGNYSRVGFHHPGPGFLYVQALGEWLFYDLLGVVPSEWNGQALAILILNAALIGVTIGIVCRWFRAADAPRWLDVAVTGTALVFLGSWADLATSTWPPFEYFAPYLLLLAAATSVAAGGVRDLWALCLATGLLVHGHAEFLLLATSLAGVSVLALLYPQRRALGRFLRAHLGSLAWAAPVVLLALLPIAANLVLHWPGEFGRYLGYGDDRAPNAPGPALWYVVQAWDLSQVLAAPVLVGSLVAMGLAARRTGHPYARWALRFVLLGLLTVFGYSVVGIDSLDQSYILFFTRALPLFALLVTVAAAVRWAPWPRVLTWSVAVGAVVLGLFSPALVNRQVTVDDTPQALARVRADDGQPIVLHLATPASWAEALPLALEGRRQGVRLCFVDEDVVMMATPAFMCTPDEVAAGRNLTVARQGTAPSGQQWVGDLGLSRIWR
jgi:hypothetical protein